MAVRLPPDQRDRLLILIDMLTAGTIQLRGRLILQGRVVVVADELFNAVASQDRLPSTVGDMLQRLCLSLEPPRTYGEACRLILLEHGAVETRRAEEAEMQAQAASEAQAEARKIRVAARAEAEKVKARAERARRKKSMATLKVEGLARAV